MSFFNLLLNKSNAETCDKLISVSILFYFKRNIFISFVLGSIIALMTLFTSMMLAYMLDHIHGYSALYIQFIIFLCFIISFAILTYINELFIKSLNVSIAHFITNNLWKHIFGLSLSTLKKIESGDFIQRFSDYESSLSLIIRSGLSVVFNLATLICLILYMSWCNSFIALCYLVISVLFFIMKALILPVRLKYISDQMVKQGKITFFLNESFLQIQKIRAANVEDKIFKHWLIRMVEMKMSAEKYVNLEIILSLIDLVIPSLFTLSLYLFLYAFGDSANPVLLLKCLICAGMFSSSMDKFSADTISLTHFLPALKRLRFILDEPTVQLDSDRENLIINGKIDFVNVDFKDSISGNLLLDNISFSIQPGQFVGFVGASGSGKSTILKLLLGVYQSSKGSIQIDNHTINSANINHIRKQFGVVLQTTNLLPGTIFSNIAANSSITMDRAWELAKAVKLDEDINKMPMKMFTYISDNAGESISGGQKQKILIARALASKPKILLLDEATSALDNESQKHIHDYLLTLNITRIVIAHRLSTIANADKIFKLEKGKLLTA